jgi:hypothetical protein
MLVGDPVEAFELACREVEMIGDEPVMVAHRFTASTILDNGCRTAGVEEPHIDAASLELMVNGGVKHVSDDDVEDPVQ